jgi:hypothetical protein
VNLVIEQKSFMSTYEHDNTHTHTQAIFFSCSRTFSRHEQILFFIEMSYVSQYYYNWKQADYSKVQALELAGLNINLTGR